MQNNTALIAIITLIVGFGLGYLVTREPEVNNDMVMGHTMDMTSMMDSMMSGLEGKTGDDFDKAFIKEMIVHHEGAVAMAESAKVNAKHQEIKNMADAIITAQTSEIAKMKMWLKDWYNEVQ